MSGRRCKALRRAFRKEHGRAPDAVEIRHWGSWWREWDKATGSLFRKGRGIGSPGAVSEWRRVKKAYLRSAA